MSNSEAPTQPPCETSESALAISGVADWHIIQIDNEVSMLRDGTFVFEGRRVDLKRASDSVRMRLIGRVA